MSEQAKQSVSEQVKQSAVSFKGKARFHLGLKVADLTRSLEFYSRVFNQPPTKIREGYAKFEVPEPSVNFTLNETKGPVTAGVLSHMGIQLQDTGALSEKRKLFEQWAMINRVEEQTSCCFAVQDKFWLHDPDGNEIEFFVVLEKDAPVAATASACCG